MKKDISEKTKKKEINAKQRTKERERRKQWSKDTSQGRTIKPKCLLNKKTLEGKKKRDTKERNKRKMIKKCEERGNGERKKTKY